jgi:hypothetical protein
VGRTPPFGHGQGSLQGPGREEGGVSYQPLTKGVNAADAEGPPFFWCVRPPGVSTPEALARLGHQRSEGCPFCPRTRHPALDEGGHQSLAKLPTPGGAGSARLEPDGGLASEAKPSAPSLDEAQRTSGGVKGVERTDTPWRKGALGNTPRGVEVQAAAEDEKGCLHNGPLRVRLPAGLKK